MALPEPEHPGTRYLYGEAFPRGKGRFVPVTQTATAAELPDPDYPFLLNTGRLLYHWHGGTHDPPGAGPARAGAAARGRRAPERRAAARRGRRGGRCAWSPGGAS